MNALAAVANNKAGPKNGKVFTEEDWNTESRVDFEPYRYSKVATAFRKCHTSRHSMCMPCHLAADCAGVVRRPSCYMHTSAPLPSCSASPPAPRPCSTFSYSLTLPLPLQKELALPNLRHPACLPDCVLFLMSVISSCSLLFACVCVYMYACRYECAQRWRHHRIFIPAPA